MSVKLTEMMVFEILSPGVLDKANSQYRLKTLRNEILMLDDVEATTGHSRAYWEYLRLIEEWKLDEIAYWEEYCPLEQSERRLPNLESHLRDGLAACGYEFEEVDAQMVACANAEETASEIPRFGTIVVAC